MRSVQRYTKIIKKSVLIDKKNKIYIKLHLLMVEFMLYK